MKAQKTTTREELKSWSTTSLLKEWSSWRTTDMKSRRNWSTLKKELASSAMMELLDRGLKLS